MSRIQNILEKAERDGGMRRMRTLVEAAPPPTRVVEVAPPAPALTPYPAPLMDDTAAPAVATTGAPAFAPAGPPAAVPAARIVQSSGFDPALVAVHAPGAAVAEQYRSLRTRLASSDRGIASDVILVTSPGRGEGKTLTAANLALTIAQDCQTRVCLVDADLRHPRLHTVLGLPDSPGLAQLLTGEATLADALVTIDGQQITVLPAGTPPAHPAELLGSTAMRRVLQTLRPQFDRVIVDGTSASPLADVGILSPIVDSVILVVEAGVTTKPAIQDAVSAIGQERVLGVVLNGTAVD